MSTRIPDEVGGKLVMHPLRLVPKPLCMAVTALCEGREPVTCSRTLGPAESRKNATASQAYERSVGDS